MCTALRKCTLCLPRFRIERGHRVDHTSYTRWCETICSSVVIVLTSLHWEKVNSLWARIICFWHATKKVWLFHLDRPANVAWNQEVAFCTRKSQVARFHPYGEIKEMFEKRHQEAKQKALIQRQHHTRKNPGVFLMCDSRFDSLGSRKILDGLRYREWMHEVWESYKLFAQRIKEDSLDDQDLHLV